ncbi:glycosyltransferase family 2 protein [Acetobacter sp.]|jgi:GT2 family glycosyltransferase|uniref:glycosyltransferase family 2 protein n=1 Tax=Acetobacter sp. TaxID=440 RepID=UPI0025B7B67D|nr:glycosyltransferase [Acetobacter sp.]MCH4092432.1 glycosyltransferase [Acetobacter sp.]MCI1299565.1 glycosyltransferase [Acetobacter sp.]MCI1315555.1 glycosyltransferase [Acetobacter sp.]
MTGLPDEPKVIVGLATSGRASVLASLVRELNRQSVRPDRIVICHKSPTDIEGVTAGLVPGCDLVLLQGGRGLPAQRNVILDHARDADVVLFLDDDFFPRHDYLENMLAVFKNDSHIAGMTGRVLEDGAVGPGLTVEHALAVLAKSSASQDNTVVDVFNTYGCNMAFRLDVVRRTGIRFDERLPLYAWYEDIDFSRRILPYGRIVRGEAAQGVHLGSKKGKTSGLRLGYSQIVNPLYLARKGSYLWGHAFRSAGRHTLINIVRSFRPEPWVDRKGRMKGNWLAWRDVLRGRLRPEHILDL